MKPQPGLPGIVLSSDRLDALFPKHPNASGETHCIVRWMVEMDGGLWLGAWEREAFDVYVAAQVERAVDAARERCAMICEGMGAMESMNGQEHGSAAMVRVADRMADLCAVAIREAQGESELVL